jgi:protein-disulfide isomerase
MNTSDRQFNRRRIWGALSAGFALAAVIAIAWMLFGSGLSNGSGLWKILPQFALSGDDTDRLISKRWVQIYYDRTSPDTGPDGDVTIVAFLDYDSADCREVAIALAKLREVDRGVRIVFKELVPPGSNSEFAARAALAADRQDRFLSMHKELTHGPLHLTESSVIMAAGMAGLDIERLRADMNDPAIANAIKENRSLALALGISSSPALIIGDRIFHGATDLGTLQAAVAQARTRPPE